MRAGAARELAACRDEFIDAVHEVLADEPGGLDAVDVRRRVNQHPGFDTDVRMQDAHLWLSWTTDETGVVIDHRVAATSYVLEAFVDDREACRPRTGAPAENPFGDEW